MDMNEQIKALADQAGLSFYEGILADDTVPTQQWSGPVTDLNKFAELVWRRLCSLT